MWIFLSCDDLPPEVVWFTCWICTFKFQISVEMYMKMNVMIDGDWFSGCDAVAIMWVVFSHFFLEEPCYKLHYTVKSLWILCQSLSSFKGAGFLVCPCQPQLLNSLFENCPWFPASDVCTASLICVVSAFCQWFWMTAYTVSVLSVVCHFIISWQQCGLHVAAINGM